MGKIFLFLLFIFTIMASPFCNAQTAVMVSDPRLEMVANSILISYDILHSNSEEEYIVTLIIKDDKDMVIDARTLIGDIGIGVSGGNNKQITWDLEADNVFINEYIYVQINAALIAPVVEDLIVPETEEEVHQEEVVQEEVDRKETPQPTHEVKQYSRTGILMQSLAFPGLGLSRMSEKPHWIRGAVGYGCLAGSFILRQKALKTYEGIDRLFYFDEINETYDKALQQEKMSDILLYTAIGIWISDFVWTLVGTSDLNGPDYSSESKRLSFGSTIEPRSKTPLLSVTYKF